MEKMMKKSLIFVFTALCVQLFASAAADLPVGKVDVEDFLNVRLGPGIKHPVTGRLKVGQQVQIIRICGSWLEIKAPENLPVYLSEARVGADGKLSGELNMRCRMDVNSPTYGLLPAGTVVKRLDERANGWVRIVPPEQLKVYVAAILVRFDRNAFNDSGIPKNAAPQAAAPVPAQEEKAVEAAPAAPFCDTPRFLRKEEKAVEAAPAAPAAPAAELQKLSGIIIKWKFAKSADMSYALLDKPDGKNQAFIIMDNMETLAAFENKAVDLHGSFAKEENGIKYFKAATVSDAAQPAAAAK